MMRANNMGKMKKINIWIAIFFASMVVNVIDTTLFAIGTNMAGDIIRILANVVNAAAGIYIVLKVYQRDEMINENETLKTLIYYKEHSKRPSRRRFIKKTRTILSA